MELGQVVPFRIMLIVVVVVVVKLLYCF